VVAVAHLCLQFQAVIRQEIAAVQAAVVERLAMVAMRQVEQEIHQHKAHHKETAAELVALVQHYHLEVEAVAVLARQVRLQQPQETAAMARHLL
jgi:hypothetical protein